uniref:Uncharacterized protein n=1 Tax=Oryza sativa subsp. japonica TaxID=39947 RepID=Q652R5_ORYSJ|nr:hypothetical protein [Oryza sativa Japonica Group]
MPTSRWVLEPGMRKEADDYPEGNFGGNQLLDGSIGLIPIPKSDKRFVRQYRFEPPLDFPLTSPRSSIIHHLSGPDMRTPIRTLHRRSGRPKVWPARACHLSDSLRIPGFKTRRLARMSDSVVRVSKQVGWGACRPLQRSAPRGAVTGCADDGYRRREAPRLWPPAQSTTVHALSQFVDQPKPFCIRPGRIIGPHLLLSRRFQALFDSLFNVIFIFPSWCLFAINLSLYLALDGVYRPIWAAFPNNQSR